MYIGLEICKAHSRYFFCLILECLIKGGGFILVVDCLLEFSLVQTGKNTVLPETCSDVQERRP